MTETELSKLHRMNLKNMFLSCVLSTKLNVYSMSLYYAIKRFRNACCASFC